jgi:hypothetical protein
MQNWPRQRRTVENATHLIKLPQGRQRQQLASALLRAGPAHPHVRLPSNLLHAAQLAAGGGRLTAHIAHRNKGLLCRRRRRCCHFVRLLALRPLLLLLLTLLALQQLYVLLQVGQQLIPQPAAVHVCLRTAQPQQRSVALP